MLMELSLIKILKIMELHPPNKIKIQNRVEKILNGESLTLTLDETNTLLDGYASYLAYKQLGIKVCNVEISDCMHVRIHRTPKIDELFEAQKGICYICGRKCINGFKKGMREDLYATIDHVIPLSKGGADNLSNMKMACKTCNNLKGSFTYSEALVEVIKQELKERGML